MVSVGRERVHWERMDECATNPNIHINAFGKCLTFVFPVSILKKLIT